MNPVIVSTVFVVWIWVLTPCLESVEIAELSSNPDDAIFNYYVNPARKQEIIFNSRDSLAKSALKRQATTVIIIDGFLSNGSSPMTQSIKNAFLATRRHQNVIVLDWGKLSGAEVTLRGVIDVASTYVTVLNNIDPLAERAAEFIRFLLTNSDISPNKVEIVGHSLGAHVAGAAGFWFHKKYAQKISRITGLDPAGPMFSKQVNEQKRLEKSDADFVAIYHTNRGQLGDASLHTGHIDVYVNGGAKQPGCEQKDFSPPGLCSHSFSWQFFNVCFTRIITACPCSGIQCQCQDCNLTCVNPITLGYATPSSARGAYHVKTATL